MYAALFVEYLLLHFIGNFYFYRNSTAQYLQLYLFWHNNWILVSLFYDQL